MNCKRSAVGAVAVNDHLYVCGGFDGLSSLDTVERFDPGENGWSMVSNMTKHRSAAGVVTLLGKIYALGGHNGLSIFDSVEMLDTVTGVWAETVPMLSKRCRLGVATLHGEETMDTLYNDQFLILILQGKFMLVVDMMDPHSCDLSNALTR